jgi:hypothetical protein
MRYNIKPILSVNNLIINLNDLVKFINTYTLPEGNLEITDEVELNTKGVPAVINNGSKDILSLNGVKFNIGDVFIFRNDKYLYIRRVDRSDSVEFQFINLVPGQICISNNNYNYLSDIDDIVKADIGTGYLPIDIGVRRLYPIDQNPTLNDPHIYFTDNAIDSLTKIPGTILELIEDNNKYVFNPIINWSDTKLIDVVNGIEKPVSPTIFNIYLDKLNISDTIGIRIGDNSIESIISALSNINLVNSEDDIDDINDSLSSLDSLEISPKYDKIRYESNMITDYINLSDSTEGDILDFTIHFSRALSTPLVDITGDRDYIKMNGVNITFHKTKDNYDCNLFDSVDVEVVLTNDLSAVMINNLFEVQYDTSHVILYPVDESILEYYISNYKLYKS